MKTTISIPGGPVDAALDYRFRRHCCGPFCPAQYKAVLTVSGVTVEEHEVFVDWMNPLGPGLARFGLDGGYRFYEEDYYKAKIAVHDGTNFRMRLYQDAVVLEEK